MFLRLPANRYRCHTSSAHPARFRADQSADDAPELAHVWERGKLISLATHDAMALTHTLHRIGGGGVHNSGHRYQAARAKAPYAVS